MLLGIHEQWQEIKVISVIFTLMITKASAIRFRVINLTHGTRFGACFVSSGYIYYKNVLFVDLHFRILNNSSNQLSEHNGLLWTRRRKFIVGPWQSLSAGNTDNTNQQEGCLDQMLTLNTSNYRKAL